MTRDLGVSIYSTTDEAGDSTYVRMTDELYQSVIEFGRTYLIQAPFMTMEEGRYNH